LVSSRNNQEQQQETMNHQQANPNTIAEFNFNTYGNEDSKGVAGPRDEAIVNADAGDVPGDESLTTVCAHCICS
jgi:hypothetical protein